jgi:hypothetical protein
MSRDAVRPALGQFATLAGVATSVLGVAAVVTAVLAGTGAWLFLTDPVTVVTAVDQRDLGEFLRAIAGVLLGAVRGLARYLVF